MVNCNSGFLQSWTTIGYGRGFPATASPQGEGVYRVYTHHYLKDPELKKFGTWELVAGALKKTPLAGFLATRVLPGAIGHSILRTSVKTWCIPLSNSQDPELVLQD